MRTCCESTFGSVRPLHRCFRACVEHTVFFIRSLAGLPPRCDSSVANCDHVVDVATGRVQRVRAEAFGHRLCRGRARVPRQNQTDEDLHASQCPIGRAIALILYHTLCRTRSCTWLACLSQKHSTQAPPMSLLDFGGHVSCQAKPRISSPRQRNPDSTGSSRKLFGQAAAVAPPPGELAKHCSTEAVGFTWGHIGTLLVHFGVEIRGATCF